MPDLSEVGVTPPIVKLSRPSLREFTRTAKSQIDDRVTRVTEPEVTLTEAQLLKLSAEATDKEDFAAKAISTVDWGEFDVDKLIDVMVALRKAITGIDLHEGYQSPFERRVYLSMLRNDGDELTLLISRQGGKCFAKGTMCMLFDGTVKSVEEVRVGDVLMGDDSTPRTVTSLARGTDQMYAVQPRSKSGKAYTINSAHILSLQYRDGSKHDVSVADYLAFSPYMKADGVRGYRAPVSFPARATPLDPYFLGLWLGDGRSAGADITTNDPEIVDYLHTFAASLGLDCVTYDSNSSRCPSYNVGRKVGTKGYHGKRGIINILRNLGVLDNKHIPSLYLRNDRPTRLALLAGLIDSDGHKPIVKAKHNTCDITLCNKTLAEGVFTLGNQLGFRAKITPRIAKCNGKSIPAWRVILYGDFSEVPTILPRKQWRNQILRENPLTYGFDLTPVGVGEYYGFTLTGNRRFLLDDCTVVHNTELLSCVVPTLCLVLPALASVFPEQLSMYAKGVFVGIYAPSGEQASTLYSRVLGRSNSAAAEEIMADPDFNVFPVANTRWSNGSFVFHQSADPRSKVESKTYHLLLGEETQGLQYRTIEKSLIPMVASTNGTIVLVGTAVDFKCYFHDAIIRNKVEDIRNPENRKHYEYDYTEVQKYNPRYAAHVAKMIKRYGVASPYFQMSYCNKFLLEEGMAVTERDFKANMMLSSYGIARRSDRPVTIGIDQARKRNKTIVTVAELTQTTLDFEDGVTPETRHSNRVIAWLELDKIAWSMQRKLIAQFLTGFSDIRMIAFDSTGPGDANYESFVEEYPDWPTIPVIFSAVSKEHMKDVFYEYYWSKRLQIPTDKRARQSKEWQAFWLEWVNVEKVTVNNRTYFRKNDKVGASDDYVDSLLLMLMATEEYMKSGHDGTEVAANLIFKSQLSPETSPSFAALRARHRNGGSATISGMRDARHSKLHKGMIA